MWDLYLENSILPGHGHRSMEVYGGLAFLDSDCKPGALMRSDPGPVDDDPVVEEIKEALKEDCNTLRYPCGKGK